MASSSRSCRNASVRSVASGSRSCKTAPAGSAAQGSAAQGSASDIEPDKLAGNKENTLAASAARAPAAVLAPTPAVAKYTEEDLQRILKICIEVKAGRKVFVSGLWKAGFLISTTENRHTPHIPRAPRMPRPPIRNFGRRRRSSIIKISLGKIPPRPLVSMRPKRPAELVTVELAKTWARSPATIAMRRGTIRWIVPYLERMLRQKISHSLGH